jgi:GrpB-like predicted nucleotidyltransferase (UPF0157 family)/GNAT superfamily N-acetyltransferase
MTLIPIEVVPYDPLWPLAFEEEKRLLEKVVGDHGIAIYHIGSTSVPGLKAKPTLDILMVVENPPDIIPLLEAADYTYKGEYNIPFRYSFTKRTQRKVNLHVFAESSPEIELNLLFRDYLRTHPEAVTDYARLKEQLLTHPSSFERTKSHFKGYTLGKDSFIRKILQQAGFNRLRLMQCTHHEEWQVAGQFRQKYFFDALSLADPYTWTFEHEDHRHFVLYQGIDIIGYAHIQLWPEKRACLRIIVIDKPLRNKGFGKQLLAWCEQWLKEHGYQSLHMASSPEALPFYQTLGYEESPLNDPDHESDPRDTEIAKTL